MSLWLVRAGGHGEYEQKFLEENRIYLTWEGLKYDLSECKDRAALKGLLSHIYPESSKEKIDNHAGQIWAFSHRISIGDWIVIPSKYKPAIHIGEVKGEYSFNDKGIAPFYHFCKVKWIETDIPRTNFDQDLLYSFGAFLTICMISRNDAEVRVRQMARSGWKSKLSEKIKDKAQTASIDENMLSEDFDLEEIGRDKITRQISAKYKGHGMSHLVNAILKALGYTTYVSPPGPDKGVDILASQGPLGFGSPRICVQVKSGDIPVDRPTLDQLIGAMQNFQAEQGLLVSWSGFKISVDKEKPSQFFKVRLWDRNDLINQLIEHYDKLDADVKADLPLKQIWTVAISEENSE
ncbi:MAG: restriction endonuclease [Candidatus Zixiibacteriota bacterium]